MTLEAFRQLLEFAVEGNSYAEDNYFFFIFLQKLRECYTTNVELLRHHHGSPMNNCIHKCNLCIVKFNSLSMEERVRAIDLAVLALFIREWNNIETDDDAENTYVYISKAYKEEMDVESGITESIYIDSCIHEYNRLEMEDRHLIASYVEDWMDWLVNDYRTEMEECDRLAESLSLHCVGNLPLELWDMIIDHRRDSIKKSYPSLVPSYLMAREVN